MYVVADVCSTALCNMREQNAMTADWIEMGVRSLGIIVSILQAEKISCPVSDILRACREKADEGP